MKRYVVGLVLVAACSADALGPQGVSHWSWEVGVSRADYTVVSDPGRFGAMGMMLLRGSWTLTIAPDSGITGTWSAHWLGADTLFPVGPQVGSGHLAGRLESDGSLRIDMNPGSVDNNVFVYVGPDGGGTDATWVWSTIAGPASGGPFRVGPPTF